MEIISGLLFVAYIGAVIAVIIYLLRLAGRFVSAHERVAGSLETVARKLREDAKELPPSH